MTQSKMKTIYLIFKNKISCIKIFTISFNKLSLIKRMEMLPEKLWKFLFKIFLTMWKLIKISRERQLLRYVIKKENGIYNKRKTFTN